MGESAPVENLLSEQPVDKLEEFSKEASEIMEEKPMPKNLLAGSGDKSPETAQIVAASDEGATQATKKLENLVINAQPETLDSEPEVNQASVANTPKPSKKPDTLERPSALHAPGSSPETLAFVRNALEQASEAAPKSIPAQEPPASAAAEASSVEPASGFASGARRFYVQLSSITDQARSDAEWAKLQTRYPSMLDNAPHRVQRAELGDRGTFYRIQAGPFEKDGAVSICEQIKSVNPNGCLVVK